MSEANLSQKITPELAPKPKNLSYYIKSIIGIAIMLFFQYIPAPPPITQPGMALLGFFIGLVVLWTLVDLVWPTFVAIILFGFIAKDIYPNSWQLAGIYEAGQQSFGNWIVIFVIGTLLLAHALQKVGTIRRITFWFLTRNFAKKNPWTFTFMFLLSSLVVGCFLDVTVAQFFMLFIAHELFEELGFKKGDHWPKIVIVGLSFSVIIAFAMTPICHTLPILWMGILSGMTGEPVNFFSYMLVGIPVGFIIWLIMFFWFRYVVKPDISQFEKVNFDFLDSKKPGPMDKREKWVATVCLLLVIAWIIPGILSFIAPQSAIVAFMDRITVTTPLLLAIVILAVVRPGGEPLLDLKEAFANISWTPVVLLAGIMMIAGSMGEATTGIPDWIAQNIVPLASGMSPFLTIAIICILSIILTNIANNVPVGIIFVTVGVPMALSIGLNPVIIGMAVCIGANLAFTIPPAFVPVGVAYSDPYCAPGTVFRNGVFMTIVSCIVTAILVYPLSLLFF